MKVSAYIICKNEAQVIERCMASLKNTAEEIVVVDSGSSDDTLQIADSLGAVTHTIEWRDDFAYARNYALARCSGEWVVTLDADEYLNEPSGVKVLQYIQELSKQSQYDGLACKLINIDPSTQKEISRMTKLIAFKNVPGLSYVRPIHERLLRNGKDMRLFYAEDVIVLHTGYVLDADGHSKKTKRNIQLIEKSISEGTADATDYYHLVQLYMGEGRSAGEIYDAAEKMYSLDEKAGDMPGTVAHRKYTLLAKAMQLKGFPHNEVLSLLDEADQKFPNHPEVLSCRADELMNAKRFDHAITAFEDALRAQAAYQGIASNNFAQRVREAAVKLAELYAICGKPAEALDRYYGLLKENRYDQAATLGLLFVIRKQELADSVMLLDTLYSRKSREDVAYLTGCLTAVCIPTLLVYYENNLRTQFNVRGAAMIASLLCAGKYRTAAEISLEFLANYSSGTVAAMACAGIILDDAYADFELILKSRDAKSAAILEAFRGMLAGRTKSAPDGFAEVLAAVIQPLSDEQAAFYAEKTAAMDKECFDSVAIQLQRIRRYAFLEKLFETRAQKYAMQKGEDLFFAGVNAMMQNEFGRAVAHFSAALHSGFYNGEVQELLRISKGVAEKNSL